MKKTIKAFRIKSCFLIISSFFSSYGFSEVTLDGSMGTAGALNGPDYKITEDLGRRAGNNLFHSFDQLNLNNTESATFSGSAGIKNVISRVTGGQSDINGTLRVTIPDANLYLLNPSGILFGKDAKLDVPGSFHASTADTLKFRDGAQLNNGEIIANPILTTAEPEAFGFLDDNPASISLTGGNNTLLEVNEGKTLSLVGGDITIKDSSLYAPGGQINIASVGSIGDVNITESGLDIASFGKMGNINISQNPLIPLATTEQNRSLFNIDVSANSAGKVFIRGGEMVMRDAVIASNTKNNQGDGIDIGLKNNLDINGIPESTYESGIIANTSGEGNAGNIVLTVEGDIELSQGTRIKSSSNSSGNSGDLIIDTSTLHLKGNDSGFFPEIFTSAKGGGDSGNIEVTATNEVRMSDGSFILSKTTANGNAGTIKIDTGSLKLHNNAAIRSKTTNTAMGSGGDIAITASDSIDIHDNSQVSNVTYGEGDSGNINIAATDKFVMSNEATILSKTTAEGDAGAITIDTGSLILHDNADIYGNVANTAEGSSGDITINASKSIYMLSNSDVANITFGEGDSGNINISTNDLDIYNNSRISNITHAIRQSPAGHTEIDEADEALAGNSGDISIQADAIRLREKSAEITNGTYGTGHAGNVTLKDVNSLDIRNGSRVSMFTTTKGNGGILEISSQSILIDNKEQSAIFTGIFNQTKASSSGNAGNLTLNVGDLKILNSGEISASTLGKGNSGNLMVNAHKIFIDGNNNNNADDVYTGITNQAGKGSFGDAGDLTVNVDYLNILNNGEISSSAYGIGNGGNLKVDAHEIFIDGNNTDGFTGITNQARGGSIGSVGDLEVTTDSLEVINNAQISASTTGSGKAGNLKIKTSFLEVRNDAQISASTFGKGQAGNLTIEADNIVLNNADILSKSNKPESTAKSGNIDITVNNSLQLENTASISVRTKEADAGMIEINGDGILRLSNSEITTSVAEGRGKGGNITIASSIVALDNSFIVANAKEGNGGNINISGILFKSPQSDITATSILSMDGEVNDKPDSNISGSIAVLPEIFMNESMPISERCATRNGHNLSGFVVKEREELFTEPGDLAPSNIIDYSTDKSISFQKTDGLNKQLSNSENSNQLSILDRDCAE